MEVNFQICHYWRSWCAMKGVKMRQTIYYGGTIRTMDEKEQAEAVLVCGGRIAAVGSLAQIEQEAQRRVRENGGEVPEKISLEGKTMLPAFIDAHSHLSAYASQMLQADLGKAESFEDIRKILREYKEKHHVPAGAWVRGQGYDHNRLKERSHPDRKLLDQALPDNPVMIAHQSGHVGVFNSSALEALGVDEQTEAPEGGRIAKKDGFPTGYMEENAFLEYMKKAPMASAREFMDAFGEAQKCYASHGITTVQEGMTVEEILPFYQMLTSQSLLYLDVVLYADMNHKETLAKALEPYRNGYREHVRFGGWKIFLDGSPQSKTAWLREPYEHAEDGYRGYGTMSDEAVKNAIRQAFRDRMQLLAHCNGDAACAQYIRCYRQVKQEFPGQELHPVIIHAQLLGTDQLEQVKKLGMIPSFFVAHVYHWGEIHRENFGGARASRISPCRSALEHNIRFTFHQDTPVIAPDMLETVWCAVNRKTAAGRTLGEQERISVEEALKAVTIHAAWQYGEEREKGSITPGKSADFVILDKDPCAVEPETIRHIRVLCTVKAGKTVYEA